MRTVLKVVGLVVLVGGVLGLFVGGFTTLMGQMETHESNDGLLFPDSERAQRGQEMSAAGVAIIGGSLLVSGLGLVLLVAGIALGGGAGARQSQQQQIIVVPDQRRT